MYQGSKMYTPACAGYATEKELQDILQLEQELTRMTMHMRDDRFKSTHASAKAIPLERLIICVLHCPMRTHEQVLTLLLQHACQNRLPNKSVPILDEIVAILRILGNLKDTWNYEWLTGATCMRLQSQTTLGPVEANLQLGQHALFGGYHSPRHTC
jgi:hypothetical protein